MTTISPTSRMQRICSSTSPLPSSMTTSRPGSLAASSSRRNLASNLEITAYFFQYFRTAARSPRNGRWRQYVLGGLHSLLSPVNGRPEAPCSSRARRSSISLSSIVLPMFATSADRFRRLSGARALAATAAPPAVVARPRPRPLKLCTI